MISSVEGLMTGMRFFFMGSFHSPSMNSWRWGIGIAIFIVEENHLKFAEKLKSISKGKKERKKCNWIVVIDRDIICIL